MAHRVFLAAAALVLTAVSACASAGAARRGAPPQDIHGVFADVMTAEGYRCEPSPDRSAYSCTHAELTDLSFAYLPHSNLVQLWAVFSRADDGLDARWRTEDCDSVHKDVNAVNDEVIIKFVCTPKALRFETVTWVPDGGLNADDVKGLIGVFHTVIGEVVRDRMLPAAPAADGPATATTDI